MNIKRVAHHIRHTRPQWYQDYHKWKYHVVLHWVTFVVSSIIIMVGFVNIVFQMTQNPPVQKAHAATTTLSQSVTGGSLTIANNGNQSMTSASVSTSQQETTGSLGTITVTDSRGTGVGWTAAATSTNFYKINSAVLASGSNNTLTVDGTSTYASSSAGTYTVTIDGGGASGVATYTVSGLETQTTTTTGTGVAIGTRGVTATFGAATYVIGDSWTIRVDTINVTNMNITPVDPPTAVSGSITGVTGGSFHVFSSPTDSATIMTAASGDGLGEYTDAPSLKLIVPANSYANTYTATVTETVS